MRSLVALVLLGSLPLSVVTVACVEEPAPDSFEPAVGDSVSTGTKSTTKKTTATPAPTTSVPDRTPPTTDATPAPTTPLPDPVPSDTTWMGTLAQTTSATFGGDPYCTYRTHFENVKVKLTLVAGGTVKVAEVTANAVEEGLNGCPNAPIAPNLHDYVLAAPAGVTFTAPSAAGNLPHAAMRAEVDATGRSGSVLLTWHRDDMDAPFDWTITATVPLSQN